LAFVHLQTHVVERVRLDHAIAIPFRDVLDGELGRPRFAELFRNSINGI
jgi:hypothetical protein